MTIEQRRSQEFIKGQLTKEMVRILRAEVDESKMDAEEEEYWDRVKDGEDEEDEGTGDRVDQDRLTNCCVGDGVGDGGCGSGGTLPAAMIDGDDIRGDDGGAENHV